MKKSNKTAMALGLGGLAAGVGLGILFAPKSGKETRQDLMNMLDNLSTKVKSLKKEDVKKYVDKNIKMIKKNIDELSVEKVAKVAKKKAKEVEKSIADLAKYVKEKGTPVLEDAVEQIRLKAIEVTEGVLEKLENK